jgi:hypothetical protein
MAARVCHRRGGRRCSWALSLVTATAASSSSGASDGHGAVEQALGLVGWEGCDLEVLHPSEVTVQSLSALTRPVMLVNATAAAWGPMLSRGAALYELLSPAAELDVEVRLPLGINQVRKVFFVFGSRVCFCQCVPASCTWTCVGMGEALRFCTCACGVHFCATHLKRFDRRAPRVTAT